MTNKVIFVLANNPRDVETISSKLAYSLGQNITVHHLTDQYQMRGLDKFMVIETDDFSFRSPLGDYLRPALNHYHEKGRIVLWLQEKDWRR